ncbi:hypothetical protein V2J09_015342 [Rumex salicifolius]
MNMDEKMLETVSQPPEHLCYVRCNFCSTVLAVVIPCKRLLDTVTVKCGHCSNLSFLSTRPPPPVQPPRLDHELTLQGFNFMDKSPPGCCSEPKKEHSSSSTISSEPVSPRETFVVKPPEKKHRLPSAYNRFMKKTNEFQSGRRYSESKQQIQRFRTGRLLVLLPRIVAINTISSRRVHRFIDIVETQAKSEDPDI